MRQYKLVRGVKAKTYITNGHKQRDSCTFMYTYTMHPKRSGN